MRKFLLFIFITMLGFGCSSTPPTEQATLLTTPSSTATLIAKPAKTSTTFPDFTEAQTCEPSIEYVATGVRMKFWSEDLNTLFYTTDPQWQEWYSFPDLGGIFEAGDVFPFLTPSLEELILHDSEPNLQFSYAPSGTQAIYWVDAYTRPKPTPGDGLSSEHEFLTDIYLVKDDGEDSQFIARVEGRILGTAWSPNERYLYLTFSRGYPGEFLLQIDLDTALIEVLLPKNEKRPYREWIALSPDGKWIAYQFNDTPGSVRVLNLETRETKIVSNLPEFFVMIWINGNRWVLLSNEDDETIFYQVEEFTNNIITINEFDIELYAILAENYKPLYSPGQNQITFFRDDFANTQSVDLYLFRMCSIP